MEKLSWQGTYSFIIVYHDVGYLHMGLVRVISMKVWLEENYCLPFNDDYGFIFCLIFLIGVMKPIVEK